MLPKSEHIADLELAECGESFSARARDGRTGYYFLFVDGGDFFETPKHSLHHRLILNTDSWLFGHQPLGSFACAVCGRWAAHRGQLERQYDDNSPFANQQAVLGFRSSIHLNRGSFSSRDERPKAHHFPLRAHVSVRNAMYVWECIREVKHSLPPALTVYFVPFYWLLEMSHWHGRMANALPDGRTGATVSAA